MSEKRSAKQKIDTEERKEFLLRVPSKVETILENWRSLVKSEWDAALQKKLLKRLQKLAQQADKFALGRTSRVTLSLKQLLENAVTSAEDGVPSEVTTRELNALFLAFSVALHDGHKVETNSKPQRATLPKSEQISVKPSKRWLYLFGVEAHRIKGLLPLLEELDINCRQFESSRELLLEMESHPVIAVVCRVDLLDQLLPGPRGDLHSLIPSAVIVIAEFEDLKLRLQAMRAGVDLYLTDPLDLALFSSTIHHLIYPELPHSHRVLVVEDDPAQADYTSAVLSKANYEVEVVTEPFSVMQSVENFRPDLILMDLYMPGVSGMELTRVIEERSDFSEIPIIFLSGEQDVDVQLKALSVGGEDFVAKPIGPKRLISVVSNHIKHSEERQRRLGRRQRRDSDTGLFSHDYLVERLTRVLKLNQEEHSPMGLLFIELDEPDALSESIGISGLDAILAGIGKLLDQLTTQSDLSARFGDYSFTILSTIHGADELLAMAEEIRRRIVNHLFESANKSVNATVSIGVLPLPISGEDISEVLNRVKSVAKLAKERGGNQVQLYLEDERASDEERRVRGLIGEALKRGLFEAHYQPMVGLHSMTGEFYQALLRLRTSGNEVIPAGKFIHTAEQYGLIDGIDRWIVEYSVGLLAKRKARPHATRLFICQSLSTLHDSSRLDWLKLLLSRHDIGFNRITFEFKMADIKVNVAIAKSFIKALNKMNISSLVSEFTDDPASYRVLEQLPVHFVKVDSCYLGQLKSRQTSIIKKLHAEKMVVIAPCVEEPRAIAELWNSGADFVQGYFIQRPNGSLEYDFDDSILN